MSSPLRSRKGRRRMKNSLENTISEVSPFIEGYDSCSQSTPVERAADSVSTPVERADYVPSTRSAGDIVNTTPQILHNSSNITKLHSESLAAHQSGQGCRYVIPKMALTSSIGRKRHVQTADDFSPNKKVKGSVMSAEGDNCGETLASQSSTAVGCDVGRVSQTNSSGGLFEKGTSIRFADEYDSH